MKLALIGIAAVATAAFATPVLAQQVIEDPGYCAQFYPNANCQNTGPGNPYTDGNWRKNERLGAASTSQKSSAYPRRAARSAMQHSDERSGWRRSGIGGLSWFPRSQPECAARAKQAYAKLFGRRANVHVDFHTNLHFNDLRCLPGH